jgi:mono/diheme cytochrome c family protein
MDCAGTSLLSPIRSVVRSLSKAASRWALLGVIGSSLTSLPLVAEDPVSFHATIRPILKEHCWHCHGEEHELGGGLDARLARSLLRGGDSGVAVVAGDPERSLLYQRITSGEMPPGEKKVPAEQQALIARWIDQGASADRPEPEQLAVGDIILDSDRQHWSFQPIQRPPLPPLKDSQQARTPIDYFLLQQLEAAGLSFQDEADRLTLLRRLSYDLLGLPPDLPAIQRVLDDPSDDWYERLVDRLLASPAYGERWGRHWLDVVGYADSHGYTEKDLPRKWAWRYRDYVIRSFNADKPWDVMIVEQLAGDEWLGRPVDQVPPEQLDRLVATGYLRMVPDGTADSSSDMKVASNDVIAETVKVVSSSLLGLTVGCAQCHAHRYDPISHADYYRFRAIFEPAYNWQAWRSPDQRLVSLWTEATRQTARAVEAELKRVTEDRNRALDQLVEETFERELAKLPEELRAEARAARQTPEKERTAEQLACIKKYPFLKVNRSSVYLYLPDRLKGFNKQWDEATAAVKQKQPPEDSVDCVTEPALAKASLPETRIFYRGDFNAPREAVEPGELSILGDLAIPPRPTDPLAITTQRRLTYARHLTDGQHPLVARVLVNRFWMHHFGRGLVSTSTDFGMLGDKPSHPELLDWLADEFMRQGWSLKQLHRLIVLSSVYRQSSQPSAELLAIDPENRLLGRMPVRRLEAEVVRDALLAASGRLSSHRFGAPVPVTPDEVGQIIIGLDNRDSAGRPNGKRVDLGEAAFRRSIYVQVRRSMPLGVLEPFDNPVMVPNCGQRATSTVAPQALMMMNNEFVASNAQALQACLDFELGQADLDDRLRHLWYRVLGRSISAQELSLASQFLDSEAPTPERWIQLGHALLCSNLFLYVE